MGAARPIGAGLGRAGRSRRRFEIKGSQGQAARRQREERGGTPAPGPHMRGALIGLSIATAPLGTHQASRGHFEPLLAYRYITYSCILLV